MPRWFMVRISSVCVQVLSVVVVHLTTCFGFGCISEFVGICRRRDISSLQSREADRSRRDLGFPHLPGVSLSPLSRLTHSYTNTKKNTTETVQSYYVCSVLFCTYFTEVIPCVFHTGRNKIQTTLLIVQNSYCSTLTNTLL